MAHRYQFPYPDDATAQAHRFESLEFTRREPAQMLQRARSLHDDMARRRSVRMLSDDPVPVELIELAVATASTRNSSRSPFITALHNMGLATLTHTPSPMAFLTKIFDRPDNERPFVLFAIGYPSTGCRVPVLERKALHEVLTIV